MPSAPRSFFIHWTLSTRSFLYRVWSRVLSKLDTSWARRPFRWKLKRRGARPASGSRVILDVMTFHYCATPSGLLLVIIRSLNALMETRHILIRPLHLLNLENLSRER